MYVHNIYVILLHIYGDLILIIDNVYAQSWCQEIMLDRDLALTAVYVSGYTYMYIWKYIQNINQGWVWLILCMYTLYLLPKYNGDVCLNSYSNSRTIVCYMCNVVVNGTCVATYVDRRMPICKSVTTYRNMYNMHFYCGCDPYNHCNFVVLFFIPIGLCFVRFLQWCRIE